MRSVWACERRMVRKDMVRRMRYGVVLGMAGVAAAFGLAAGTAEAAYGDGHPGLDYAYADERVWLQESFPCTEDEVLGYSPEFGPDAVGCIHIDDV